MMHHALRKACRAILWVTLLLFGVVVMISFLGLAGCMSQRVTVGDQESCIETRALVFTNVECQLKDEVEE